MEMRLEAFGDRAYGYSELFAHIDKMSKNKAKSNIPFSIQDSGLDDLVVDI